MPLEEYRAKRDAARTPEPVPERDVPDVPADHTGDEQDGRGDTFVVQEHHATALHWDVRLERDGVLVSWAVPKGLPLDPAVNRLAKQTEDHPLAYATFGGEIPRGEYGGGHVHVWDSGTYELQKWRDREVMVVLHGRRVDGRYVFFRTRGSDWMVHRMDGPPDGWTPLPTGLRPVPPVRGALPDQTGWAYEVGWGGEPVLVAVDGGRLQVTDVDGADLTGRLPELRRLGLQLGSRQVLVEGALVVLDAAGHPQPARLAERREAARPGRALLRDAPVRLLLQDLLHEEGRDLRDLPFEERRARLEALEVHGDAWDVPPVFPDAGPAVLEAARAQGLPGAVATRLDSTWGGARVLVPA